MALLLLNVMPEKGNKSFFIAVLFVFTYFVDLNILNRTFYVSRQGKVRGLQLALVCSSDTHLRLNMELEKLKRDNMMSLIMMRNKVGREEWVMEALIVALEFFVVNFKPSSR